MSSVPVYENFIDGQFVASAAHLDVINPATGAVLSKVPASTAEDVERALAAAEAAAEAMHAVEGAIMPFPGGIARSGSKVGSRYPALMASTNHVLCPTLRGQVDDTQVPEGIGSVFEIVIDGLAPEPVAEAMRVGLEAAAQAGARRITAGNYGGNLGPHHFPLKDLVP